MGDVEFARIIRRSSPDAAFSFLSGSGGTRETEAGSHSHATRVPRLYIFPPAYIYPVEPRKEPNFRYRPLRAIYPAFQILFPNQVIPADDLARATVDVATGKHGRPEARFSRTVTSEPC